MTSLRVSVIVPAYCEARLLAQTLRQIPDSVAEIIVVDDASPDATTTAARSVDDPRIVLIRHEVNRGVGAAIYTGYEQALQGQSDVFVVMAGDNQMDPADLPALLSLFCGARADYVKGNRLAHERARDMPFARRIGTQLLAYLTSWACGIKLRDTQCGFTAISRRAAERLDFADLWPRYGYPNDLLISLAQADLRIAEVTVRPVYASERSGLQPWHFFSIIGVILRRRSRSKRPAPAYAPATRES